MVSRWLGILALDTAARRAERLGWALTVAAVFLSLPLAIGWISFRGTDGVWIADVIIQWWLTAVPLGLAALLALALAKFAYRDAVAVRTPAVMILCAIPGTLAVLLAAGVLMR